MLENSMYDSWASRICLFIKGKKNGRMMLESNDNGALVYPTIKENGQTRPKKYFELTEAQQLQDDCDVQATNIILYGLPPDLYVLVNHQEGTKDIWDKVKQLIKGTALSYQERECRLYNLFDKFAYVQGETLYEYYWIFSQLINDMHTIGMTMQQVQVNTKFLNALPPKWSKFVIDVKLAKSLYTTNYDQLIAFQTGLLVPIDSDCDDISSAKAVLMANLSSCDPDDVQEMSYSEQTHIDDYPYNKINRDSYIIPYSQYLQESQDAAQSQEKDTVIRKLKDRIKSLSGKDSVENVKKYIDKIETINIELEHRVKPTTSASGSKPSGNTKNNRITRPPRLPKLKYQKDHLCSACALGKSKKHSHKPKADDSIQEKLYLLHMDLCGPMRIQSVNGRKYILVIIDDYSRFTWVKFLRSKDEVPKFVIKFLKMIQVRLNATVRNIKTDNGIEFVIQTLRAYYEEVGISHQTLVARTSQQNGIFKRRNHTLVEAARTMLIFSKVLLFL
ncbi:retrovirus-related pol polyprotein from transposon TNT 1-94 [Tanacetum coccineum]